MKLPKRKQITNGFFKSQFSYSPLTWMMNSRELNYKVNRLHERCLRVIYNDGLSSFEELLERDNSVSVLNIKMEDVELPGQNKLLINKNLCPYYKVLWSKSKKLHSLGKISSFFISSDTIKITVSKNSLPLSITHVDDFGKYFPDIDLSPPERSV